MPERIKTLHDDELLCSLRTALDDLARAAAQARESEWHQACFAAVVLLSQECAHRRLKLSEPQSH